MCLAASDYATGVGKVVQSAAGIQPRPAEPREQIARSRPRTARLVGVAEESISWSESARERVEREGLAFLQGFYETERGRHPENLAALVELGHVYTRQGRIAEGLAVDRELVSQIPEDPTAHYNLACSLALSGARDEALAVLERSAELGYDDPEHLESDSDLASLQGDPRLTALLVRLRARTTSSRKRKRS